MEEIAKILATYGGVGGAIGALIFWFYRKDTQDNAASLRSANDILLGVVRDNTLSNIENAKSNIKLVTVIEALHSRLNRDEIARLSRDRS